jgi:hypothetical protein
MVRGQSNAAATDAEARAALAEVHALAGDQRDAPREWKRHRPPHALLLRSLTPTAGLAARSLRAITRERRGSGPWKAPKRPVFFPQPTLRSRLQFGSNTLPVETRAGRFGDYVVLSDEAGLIEVNLSLAEAVARLAKIQAVPQ